MLKNENIICISSIDWDFIWQGHQEIMSRFVKSGNRVLYIENTGVRSPALKDLGRIKHRIKCWKKGLWGFREIEKNLFVFSPLILPFPYSKIAQIFNTWFLQTLTKKWMESTSFHNPIIWTFLPTQLTINLIGNINNKCVIYYCIDSFIDSSIGAKRIVKSEEALFKLADLVFVTSHKLADKAKRYKKEVHFFPFAVNLENFYKSPSQKPFLQLNLKKKDTPVVGYVGGIHRWIDFKLIEDVARERQDWVFLMIGPIQTDITNLKTIQNILFTGSKKHDELPDLIEYFDVCIIPYLKTKYTQNVYPTKLTEYLAKGKPVVSTAILEIELFNEKKPGLIKIAKEKNSFTKSIEEYISKDNKEIQQKRIKAAEENTWGNHIEKMSQLIIDNLKKTDTIPNLWKEKFKSSYFNIKNLNIKYITYVSIIWILIFHTPFPWFLSKPLQIKSPLITADVIIALGGGVGESGQAGQGYIERSKRAIDLYNNNMAPNVLFMSGYTYLMKEAEMMKAFGVEYGIPANQIFIDSEASNTYFSMLSIATLAKKNGWKKIIIVSSPYHMRRVKFCFNKVAPKLKIIYTPVSYSSFYNWPKHLKLISWKSQITFRQLKGILHEVLGIIYYRYKGYI